MAPDSSRMVYITFDDGPLIGSEHVNQVAAEQHIPITVFVVGRNARLNKTLNRYYEAYRENVYIEIGNHSYSHARNHYRVFYRHVSKALGDFQRNEQYLDIPGKLVRLPGRNAWRLPGIRVDTLGGESVVADSLFKRGYWVFGWDLEWEHDTQTGMPVQSPESLVKQIGRIMDENKTVSKDQLVLLCHDEMLRSDRATRAFVEFITCLKETGRYKLGFLRDYVTEYQHRAQ
ncbi:MAG TPA: polysaccharide deacetylase family protein [Chitinophagaceae bacterium]|nr:polysaccharide deacetylase family protein [Chitinophagaceae bacterium]